jgi:hypothetical protein
MAPFLWFVLQVDEGMIKATASPWCLKLGSNKFVLLALILALNCLYLLLGSFLPHFLSWEGYEAYLHNNIV